MKTYWLYHSERVLTGVRMPEGTNDEDVRFHAVEQHEHHPGCSNLEPGEAPFEFESKLWGADVKTFEG